jgi:hypothetical protein
MSAEFKLSQGDLFFQSDFAEPAFGLFRDSWPFYGRLYSRLSSHGLRLMDMKPERGSGSLGDAHLACSFLNFAVTIRIRLDRVEIQCLDVTRIDAKNRNGITIGTLQTLKEHVPNLAFKSHTLAIGLHGQLDRVATNEFLSTFVQGSLKDLGPSLGSGLVFYHGAQAEQMLSAVTLDQSGVISGGLFIRIHVVWDGRALALDALPEVSEKHVRGIFTQLGLTLNG